MASPSIRSSLVDFVLPALSLVGLASCSNIDPIDVGCGNHVLEAGEFCDGPNDTGVCREPEQDGACYFDCSGDNKCPTGYGCGDDEICRLPTGAFDLGGDFIEGFTFSLDTADADGDGRADVLQVGSNTLKLHYLNDDGQVEESVEVPAFPTFPAVGELTSDDNPDLSLIVPVGTESAGLAVFQGAASRSLSSKAYVTIRIDPEEMEEMVIVPIKLPFEAQAFIVGFSDIGVVAFADLNEDSGLVSNISVPPANTAGIATANVDDKSPCEEIAVALKGDDRITIVRTCKFNQEPDGTVSIIPNFDGTDIETIALDPGSTIRQGVGDMPEHVYGTGVVFIDVPGADGIIDEHQDLIVAARDANGELVLNVAWGVGDGTFHSSSVLPLVGGGDNQMVEYEISVVRSCPNYDEDSKPVRSEFPLAIGDLNGDGYPDYVFDDGIYVSFFEVLNSKYRLASTCSPGLWQEAFIADLNGDGAPDVVANTGEEPQVTALINDGAGAFGEFPVSATGEVWNLRVGDFDGDSLDDIVFTESSQSQFTSDQIPHDVLYVAFGSPSNGPETPVSFGQLPPIEQWVGARLSGFDAADDLLALSYEGESVSLTMFYGSTNRLLQAPYVLFEDEDVLYPIGVAYDTSGGQGKLAILAARELGVSAAWLVSAVLELDDNGNVVSDTRTNLNLQLPYEGYDGARIGAADLNGDGSDEILIVTGTDIVQLSGDGTEIMSSSMANPALMLNPRSHITFADLDGDAALDAVLLKDNGEVLVLWNDGGLLSYESKTVAVSGVYPDELTTEGDPTLPLVNGVTAVNLDGDGIDDLVVAGAWGCFSVPLTGSRTFGDLQSLGALPGGTVLASADVDGDGVDDLVLGQDGSFRVLLGAAASEL